MIDILFFQNALHEENPSKLETVRNLTGPKNLDYTADMAKFYGATTQSVLNNVSHMYGRIILVQNIGLPTPDKISLFEQLGHSIRHRQW